MRLNTTRVLTMLAAATVAAAAVVVALQAPAMAQDATITAKKVAKGPTVDGKIDKIWRKAKRTKVNLPGAFAVTAKAVYTGSRVYFLFQWPDKTRSLNRVYELANGSWKKRRGNEDRFNLMWNVGDSIRNFKQKGCQIACHQDKETDESSMYTNAPGERGDIWHWKSQRTNPAGYADDQYIISERKTAHDETTGRRADGKSSGSYMKNWDKAKQRPLYMGKGRGGAILLRAKARKVSDGTKFKRGTIVPREVLERPKGSRGDVSAKGVWKKGRWTLEISRVLQTGHEDDVQFASLAKPFYFGISIHDNSDGDAHETSKVIELKFK